MVGDGQRLTQKIINGFSQRAIKDRIWLFQKFKWRLMNWICHDILWVHGKIGRALAKTYAWHLRHSIISSWITYRTGMWANTQRDGRPAEYKWRPLFNAAKFGWRPLLECRAVNCAVNFGPLTAEICWRVRGTPTNFNGFRETRWNLSWCPELANRSQRLLGRSSPYCKGIWRRYCCLTSFFRLSICAYVAKI